MEELIYKIKKDMEKSGSFSYNLNIDADEVVDMFDMIWGEELDKLIDENEKEQKDDMDPYTPSNVFKSEVKTYTLGQQSITDDLKNKLKDLGIKITRTPYGRLRFEADEYTIGIAESIYNLKFREEVLVP